MFTQKLYTNTLIEWVSSQWILIYLLGAFVACMIIAGGALGYLAGNVLVPLVLVVSVVAAIQYQVVGTIKQTSKKAVESLPFLYLTRTQEFFLSTNALETSMGLVLLTCRAQNADRLRQVLAPMCQDYGYDFVYSWLNTRVEDQLSEIERSWLWAAIRNQNTHTVHAKQAA
ncbi:hypothetical protein OsccyDRAFT_0558 [Leptolyngbyaceae cyanobacterium JSC-12]|nr:hypothetical protein OsccyDRAFT_0558 [Leptolyngbyaceae cyanobacterium JSC-12]